MIEEQIRKVLPQKVGAIIKNEKLDYECLQEIRLRVGQPVTILYLGKEISLPMSQSVKYRLSTDDIRQTIDYASNFSLYAYENELRQGFITIEGGHRVGVAGQVVLEQGKVKNLKYISSVNIRISHEIVHCADRVLPYITKQKQMCHTLIVSPPRCGKTTLLRDLIRQISNGNQWIMGSTVGVVDERSELGGCYLGIAQNDLGQRTDILDCCPKAEGMIMLIRSMSPQVIAVDEIGAHEDIRSIEYAMHCGCKMLATVHGASIAELQKRPYFEQMIKEKRFERYIVLRNKHRIGEIEGIYDERGSLLYAENCG